MDKSTNHKHKIDFLVSNDTSSIQQIGKPKLKRNIYGKCNECNKIRRPLDESNQICRICYMKTILKQSGNKIIDDFIKYTQVNLVEKVAKMEFVPYEQFKNIKFIAEGGFSKIYKATWIDGPISEWDIVRQPNYTVVLKKLNSKNITKGLNELKIFYDYSLKRETRYDKNRRRHIEYDNICTYFGITQDPITQNIIIIMPYYKSGDLVYYINNDFYNISWNNKLYDLMNIISGLINIHSADIIHRDFHSGNIFFDDTLNAIIGDLGISKSATESTDDNNENYGIIPYMAPEIFQGQKYTKASDIYSFGMIMWEFMTCRRPFWDRDHDAELIIEICDGLRPPIVTNAPEGYIELMKECWHSDPEKRPTAIQIYDKIVNMYSKELKNNKYNLTKVVPSPDIGPIEINSPGAIYKSRPLSDMINSAVSLRSSRNITINLETDPFYYYQKNNMASTEKRKFKDHIIEDNNDNNGQIVKKKKLFENENNDDYLTKEIGLDITNLNKSHNNEYITKEIDLDINSL